MTPRIRTWLGVLLVGALALGALISTAWHANTTATQLVSAQPRREALYSNAYYACLEAEARHLVRPSDRVYVAEPNLDHWVIITKALGGWAHLQQYRPHATVAILLSDQAPHSRGRSCAGQTLVSIRTHAGHVVIRRASAPSGTGVG